MPQRITHAKASNPTTAKLTLDASVLVGVTAVGVPSHRRAVMNALWRCGFSPILAPDLGDISPLLSDAKAYIEVITQPPSSRAEQVFRQAVSHELPTLLFMTAEAAKAYQRMGEALLFNTPDELGALVVQQVAALTELPEPSSRPELHPPHMEYIPDLPTPYLPHPHYLPRRMVGRAADLGALRAWFASQTPLLALEGKSGVGKSTLVWHWLLEDCLSTPEQPLLLWNFAESNGGFENFVRHALAYFNGLPLNMVDALPRPDRLPTLLNALANQPALLVLENTEHLLKAYDRLEAPHLAEQRSDSQPASSEIQTFLSALPSLGKLKTLIISRLTPSALQNRADVQHLPLGCLSESDAHTLLAQLVLYGKEEQIVECAAVLNQHPLALCLAAESGNAHPNGFGGWWQANRAALGRAADDAERVALLVEAAITELSSDARALLHYLAALRFPANYAMLANYSPFYVEPPRAVEEPRRWRPNYEEAKAAWEIYQRALAEYPLRRAAAQARLHTTLSDLETRGLLLWDRATNRYTLHPLIRAAIHAAWSAKDREAALNDAWRFFEPLAADLPEILNDESDLRAAIEVYVAWISAEKYAAAAQFYRERLSKPLLTRLVDSRSVVRLLTPLFPEGVNAPPALESVKDRAYFAHEMALALGSLGRLEEARHLLGETFALFIELNDPTWLCVALINYAGLIEDQAALRVRVFELVRKLAVAIGDVENRAVANLFLLRSYVEMGQWTAATEAYEGFSTSSARYRTTARQAVAERFIARMLLEQGQDPSVSLNLAWEFAVQSGSTAEQRAIHALWGEVALSFMQRPDAAERFFEEALRMTAPHSSLTAVYRGGLARSYAQQGRAEEVRSLIEQGVPALAAAQCYLTLGEAAQAETAALEAYLAAWAEGPPFSRWWEVEQARAVLRELRVPPPDLPPFNPNKFPPLPHDRAIRAYITGIERAK